MARTPRAIVPEEPKETSAWSAVVLMASSVGAFALIALFLATNHHWTDALLARLPAPVEAIRPAIVSRVYIDEAKDTMELVVPDDQLAKAIGKRGQNVRLADQLTGWRIDIWSESKHAEMLEFARRELARITVLDEEMVDVLLRSGFQDAKEIADADPSEVAAVLGVDEEVAAEVVKGADDLVGHLIMEEAKRRHGPDSLEPESD